GDGLDALDARDRVLQDLRDLGLDDLGAGARILGPDGDDRLVDVRVLADREQAEGHEPEKDDHQADDRREDRTADEELEGGHATSPPWWRQRPARERRPGAVAAPR